MSADRAPAGPDAAAAIAALRIENARLRAERAQADAEQGRLRAEVAAAQAETTRLQQALAAAHALIAALRRQLFGTKADRLTPEQEAQLLALQRDVVDQVQRPRPTSDEVLTEDRPPRERPPRRPRQAWPDHLETETVVLEPAPTPCAACGRARQRIGDEVTEEIDLIPAKLIRRRIVRPKYACACGDGGVAIAPLPPRLIPQSTLGLGLAVHVLLTRYDDHLSFYRLEQQLRERHQVRVPRQQMVQWVEHLAEWLQPVTDAMWRQMQATGYLQVDETPVRVLDPDVKGKAARGYLWFYAVPGGDVCLVFDRRRSLEPVTARLADFAGTIQTDAYEVYQALTRRTPGVQRIGCVAHARRRFYAALAEHPTEAIWAISEIRRLYQIEAEARGLSPPARHALRQQRAPALWAALREKTAAFQTRVLPQSLLGKAVAYFLAEYEALTGYLADGRFEIDNNLIENDIRPTAVGRKRWLFIGHPDAGWRSAVAYSVIVSCRRRGINPQDYLTDVLRRLPTTKITDIDALTPARWQPANHL
jgi:transposase